jgi:hypothetical protein
MTDLFSIERKQNHLSIHSGKESEKERESSGTSERADSISNYVTSLIDSMSSETVKKKITDKKELLIRNLQYDAKDSGNTPAFAFYKTRGKDNLTISLPSNLDIWLESPLWGPLLLYLIEGNEVNEDSSPLDLPPSTANQRLAIIGFLSRSRQGIPESGFNFTINAKSPQTLGRAHFDNEIFLMAARGYSVNRPTRFTNPKLYNDKGSKIFNQLIYSLFGKSNIKVANNIISLIGDKLNKLDKAQTYDRMFKLYSFNPSQIVPSITKKVVKNKLNSKTGKVEKKAVAIHLSRPSTIVEAVTEEEIKTLASIEEPWDNMKELMTAAKSGLTFNFVNDFEKAYKDLYTKQKEVTSKLSGWRSSRRKLQADFITDTIGKKVKYTRTMHTDYVKWVCKCFTNRREVVSWNNAAIENLMLIHLENALGISRLQNFSRYSTSEFILQKGLLQKVANETPLLSDKIESTFYWVLGNSDLYAYIHFDLAAERRLREEDNNSQYYNQHNSEDLPNESQIKLKNQFDVLSTHNLG